MARAARVCAALLIAAVFACGARDGEPDPASALAARFAKEVTMRLEPPHADREFYGEALRRSLAEHGLSALPSQYVLLVDRSAAVQAAFIYWLDASGAAHFVGAASASTGRPGAYDHFYTPVGVFVHTLDNMDFRAEGTRNAQGVRGYGIKGMRVYDFGWVEAERGWKPPGKSIMRLQVHATDPDLLEKSLGRARSKGCIRIPASLNVFIDRYGLLDANYEAAMKEGRHLWVLRADREPTPWPGRYLVVVDSGRKIRPGWCR
jgi:hypothetical protein